MSNFWILVLGILGIAIGVWYLTRDSAKVGTATTGVGADGKPVDPGTSIFDKVFKSAKEIIAGGKVTGADVGPTSFVGKTGFSPPPRVGGTAGTVATVATGPATSARKGRGHF